jgi:hypothetical protein
MAILDVGGLTGISNAMSRTIPATITLLREVGDANQQSGTG